MTLKYIKSKIGSVRNVAHILTAFEGTFKTLFALAATAIISFVLDYFLHFPQNIRSVFLGIYLCALLYIFSRHFLFPLLTKITDEQIALKVEQQNTDLKDRLISALQFSRLLNDPQYTDSRELTLQVIDETEKISSNINFLKILNFKRFFVFLLLPLFAGTVLWFFYQQYPKLSKIWWNRNVLLKQNAWPRKTTVFIVKEEFIVTNKKPVVLAIETDRKNVENPLLWYKSGNFWSRESLIATETGYSVEMPNVEKDTILYLEVDDIVSSIYRLRLRDLDITENSNNISIKLPDNKIVMSKGERLSLKILADGKIPTEVSVHYHNMGTDNWNSELAAYQGEGLFKYTFPPLVNDIEFYISGNDDVDQIPVYSVKVLNPPAVVGTYLWFDYPAYTAIKPTPQDKPVTQGNIKALEGTNIKIVIEANIEIASAKIAFPEKDQGIFADRNMEIGEDGKVLFSSFIVKGDSRYEITLEGTNGLKNASPVSYYIRMDKDANPYVKGFFVDISTSQTKVVSQIKQRSYMLTSGILPLKAQLEDDFGVSSASLQIKTNKEENWKQKSLLLKEVESAKKMNSFYNIELDKIKTTDEDAVEARDLQPGDVVSYKFSVQDNNIVSGPGKKDTETFSIEIVEKTELLKKINENLLNIKNQVGKILAIQQDKKETLEDFLSISTQVETGDLVKIHQLHFSQKSISRQVFDVSENIKYVMWMASNNTIWDVLTTNKISTVNKLALSISDEVKEGTFEGISAESTEQIINAYKVIVKDTVKGRSYLKEAIVKQQDIIRTLEEIIELLGQWEDFDVEEDLRRLWEETKKQEEVIKKWAQ